MSAGSSSNSNNPITPIRSALSNVHVPTPIKDAVSRVEVPVPLKSAVANLYTPAPIQAAISTLTSPAPNPYEGPQPPPPVIPTSWLAAHEQRWFFASIFGLIETIKVWDIIAPYITNPEPTWSNHLRLSGPFSAIGWTLFELSILFGLSLLRIPQLSPTPSQFLQLLLLLIAWNLIGWFFSEPGSFLVRVNFLGPPSLGGAWYLAWWPLLKKVVWSETPHLGGTHHIRLLPFSTATLNPLDLNYCIPPDAPQPLYIPIVFNNSVPNEVSYFVRDLETGRAEVVSVRGSSMRKSPSHQRLQINDEEEDEAGEAETDPLSALVLSSQALTQSQQLDVAKLPSVKPADSLVLIPQHLASSEHLLFLKIDKPSSIALQSVVDKRGDKFHITAGKEAIITECPVGGHFVDTSDGKIIKKGDRVKPAELRCVGDEEISTFQVKGVGALKAGWSKKSGSNVVSGVIEGIEEDIESVDQLALVRRDKVAKTHTVPLRVVHDRPGVFTLSITSVTDSLRNTYTPNGRAAEKIYNVIIRPSASFRCTSPVQLLVNSTASIQVQLGGNGPLHAPLELAYSYRGTDGAAQQSTLTMGKRTESITVSEAGVYTLLDLKGDCSGGILEPSSCRVELVPPPAVDMAATKLHEGAMDIGVNAAFEFTGTPPFVVHWTEQRTGSKKISRTRRFDAHHGEVVLQPENEGQYTYIFNSLSDRNYQQIQLNQPPIQQTVHPLANVDIVGRGDGSRRLKLYSCSGNRIDLELDAKGTPPLTLNYLKTWGTKLDNVTLPIETGRSSISVPVPEELSADRGASGKLSIVLVSIVDGDGRSRKLPAPTVEVDIQRQKPTVRFANHHKVVITEGDNARAPLRLTGNAPWEVSYSLNGSREKRVTLRDANNHLTLAEEGVYRLIKVKDAQCPGLVMHSDDTFEIAFKPRPKVELVQNPLITKEKHAFMHKGFCAGEEDQVAFRFAGQASFEVAYRYTTSSGTSRHVLKSAQEVGILHLNTEPGHHRYDIIDLKDSNYASTPVSLAIEHDVHSRPSASFVKTHSKPLCLDSAIKGDAKVRLEGKAPFILDLAIRKPGSSKVSSHSVTVKNNEWNLDLPYTVAEIGRYEITITLMKDSSGCDQVIHESDRLSTSVEVVESARIVPVSQVTDLCVGDTLDFLLQGKAPWTIEYEWLHKKHKVTSSASTFSRYAEEPGVFAVKSVALKDNQCKREISDLERHVHPLPSVKIQDGSAFLREGDEPAAFSVHFSGTPPFTFTYTRSELVGGTSSKRKILDTQTVTDISERDYTISSSLPGDYQVTSVSDKYCRYPPLKKRGET